MVQSNDHNENYNNLKHNIVQNQNVKVVIGSENEKKMPLVQSISIANQPTFGYLKFLFFSFSLFFKSGLNTKAILSASLHQSLTKNQIRNDQLICYCKWLLDSLFVILKKKKWQPGLLPFQVGTLFLQMMWLSRHLLSFLANN